MSELPNIEGASLLPIVEQSFDGIALMAPNPWRVAYANRTFAGWFGLSPTEIQGKEIGRGLNAADSVALLEQIELVSRGTPMEATSVARLMIDGAIFGPVEARLCRVMSADQPLVAIIARAALAGEPPDARLSDRRDPLTGLLDRTFLLSRLAALLRGERCVDQQFAVLFVDLDNFKQVNDAHGHLMGDRVLREVARRLANCVREGDTTARFGGDEFVVLVEQVAGRTEIQSIIGRIHAALAKPIALPDGEVTLSVSVGVAEASPDHRSPEDLLHEADRAMYASKRLRADSPLPLGEVATGKHVL